MKNILPLYIAAAVMGVILGVLHNIGNKKPAYINPTLVVEKYGIYVETHPYIAND